MRDEFRDTKDFLQNISDDINVFFNQYFRGDIAWIFQVTAKVLVLIAFYFIMDAFFKLAYHVFYNYILKKEKYPFVQSLTKTRFPQSIAHILALVLCTFALNSIFYGNMHKISKGVLDKIVDIGKVIVVASAALRMYKAIEDYYITNNESYKLIAFRAVSQTIKIFGSVILSFIAIKIIFEISSSTILGSLGAITAVLVLIFRDTILGFVTGIHVATSKNMKVGDWIGIPKYNIEGNIADISLLTTKIINFDKTVSTIPTYDLMATEIRNYQVMTEGNRRRIKRSIIFNVKSFKFLTVEQIDKLAEIDLIEDYLQMKKKELYASKEHIHHPELLINGQQLTNIGVFRIYIENYLKQNSSIDQNEIILVRQLEITPTGMPLEIYCFTIYSALVDYECVQSDIFDHLLVAAQSFDLEVMQVKSVP